MRRAVTVWAWLGLALAVPVAARAQAQSGLKIAFVSYQTILQQTPGYTAAESTFNKEVQGYRDEVQKLQQRLDPAVRSFDQEPIALSPAAERARQRGHQQLTKRLDER